METTAHFDHIPQEIARRLAAATQKIIIAVTWFTSPSLFDVVCKQVGRGLRMRLMVLTHRASAAPCKVNVVCFGSGLPYHNGCNCISPL